MSRTYRDGVTFMHGRWLERRGGRYFALPREQSNADRIAAKSNITGNWARIEQTHRTARVIRNG